MRLVVRALVAGAVALALGPAGALAGVSGALQDDPPELLTAVPETPALAFLDATVANVLEPGAARDFALALLSGTDESGTARQGFAVEATPWFLVPGVTIDGRRYRESRLAFVLANAQVSVGTARAGGEEADTDLAVGLRLTLVDRGDPLRSEEFRRALGEALVDCAPPQPAPTPSEACVGRETEEALKAWTAERWNAARLAVASAWGVRMEGSELDQRDYAGWKAWVVGSAPLGRRGQLIGQLAREERPALGEDPAFRDWTAGFRALAGSPGLHGFLELLAASREVDEDAEIDPHTGLPMDGDDGHGIWSAGIEARVAEGLWASAGFGSRFALLAEHAEKSFVLIGLRWGISSAARFEALRAEGD